MKYQFIEQYKHEFPIVVMCKILGVSESGLYAWRKRPTCQRKREDAQLAQEIRQVFVTHRGRYGSPRIHMELRVPGAKNLSQTSSQVDARDGHECQTQKASGIDHQERYISSGRS